MKPARITWFALCLIALSAASVLPALAQSNAPIGTVQYDLINVRSGPGTDYPTLGTANRGAAFPITGRNEAGDWLQVCCIGTSSGWIWRSLLVIEGSLDGVPVVAPPPRPVATPTPAPTGGWRGEYFANRDLQGSPVLVRYDADINFRWGGASPGPNVPATNFSARWTRVVTLQAGDYEFTAQADDGVRVYLDGWKVIDAWREGSLATFTGKFNQVGTGDHTLMVEYFQALGDSAVIVWWERQGQYPDWKGEYFNDIYLQPPPLLVRNDAAIDFNWGLGSPDPRVPVDNFSARWTKRLFLETGNYDFFARPADGARIYLDSWLVLDQWHDNPGGYVTYNGRFNSVGAGTHTIVVEYYARGGIAYIMVWWQRAREPVPQ